MKKQFVGISIAAALAIVFSGCSVKVEHLKQDEISKSVANNLNELKKIQQPVDGLISIDDAIQRAIKYNRDHNLKMIEASYEEKQFLVTKQGMWPSLNAQGSYTNRSNVLASKSMNITNGTQTYDYSTSNDDEQKTAEARVSWNALDFGLSYVRAKQQADKILIAQERTKKVANQIEQDVREAYWKAVSAQNMLSQLDPVIADVKKSIMESTELEKTLTGNMLESLNYRREMLDILLSLQTLKKDLLNAKPRLAVLMGMTPNEKFELSGKIDATNLPVVNLDIEQAEKLAFEHRPELMESRYQHRISLQETKAAMLSLLPGVSFDAGANYTSNSYTYNNSWFDYGIHVNMNLFKVFGAGDLQDRAKLGEKVAEEQQKAIGMAILTQLHLANIRYVEAIDGWNSASQYYDVTQKISDIAEKANSNKIGSKQQLARERLSKLIANVKRDMAYAELQNSFGNLYFSMGLSHNSANFDKAITK